jgi:hypothetical protein
MISIPSIDLLVRRRSTVKTAVELERERLRRELLQRIVDREMRKQADRRGLRH